MRDLRKLIPREPPEGFLEWAATELCGELDTYGMLYEQEWVEDWGLEQLLDEYARPRKLRMVRVECSCCGYQDLYHYGKITGWKPGGYGFVLPESYTEVDGGTVYGDGENILCPQCGTPVFICKRANVRREGYFVTAEARAMSAAVVGEDHQSAIFFIRRKNRPGESYYTLELDEKKLTVRQNRGLRNCPRTPEVQAFEDLWLSWVRSGAPRDERGKPVVSADERKGIA